MDISGQIAKVYQGTTGISIPMEDLYGILFQVTTLGSLTEMQNVVKVYLHK